MRAITPAAVDSRIVCSLQSKRFRRVFRNKKSISVFWMRTKESSFSAGNSTETFTSQAKEFRNISALKMFLKSTGTYIQPANVDVFP